MPANIDDLYNKVTMQNLSGDYTSVMAEEPHKGLRLTCQIVVNEEGFSSWFTVSNSAGVHIYHGQFLSTAIREYNHLL